MFRSFLCGDLRPALAEGPRNPALCGAGHKIRPDWLFVLIGINDIHSHLLNLNRPIPPQLYEEAYDDVLARTRKSLPGCRIFLAEPFYISRESSSHSFRHLLLKNLPAYIE